MCGFTYQWLPIQWCHIHCISSSAFLFIENNQRIIRIRIRIIHLVNTWWLASSPHSERVPGSTPGRGLSVWSLHVLPVYAWVLSGYSGFLPPSKNMHVRLIGVSKTVLRSECECVFVVACLCVATAGIGSSPPASRPMD